MKICINCQHYREGLESYPEFCRCDRKVRTETRTCVVTGLVSEVRVNARFCVDERQGECGPDAKYYVPRPPRRKRWWQL